MGNTYHIKINTRLHRFARNYMRDDSYDPIKILKTAEAEGLFELIDQMNFISDMEGYITWYDIRGNSKTIGRKSKKCPGRMSNKDRFEMRVRQLEDLDFVLEGSHFVHKEKKIFVDRRDVYGLKKSEYLRFFNRLNESTSHSESEPPGKQRSLKVCTNLAPLEGSLAISEKDLSFARDQIVEAKKQMDRAEKFYRMSILHYEMIKKYHYEKSRPQY